MTVKLNDQAIFRRRSMMTVQGKTDFLFTNWAKTYSSHPELFFEPQNVEELAQVFDVKLFCNTVMQQKAGKNFLCEVSNVILESFLLAV